MEIDNLRHLEDVVLGCQDEFIRFDLDDDRVIAIHMATARQVRPFFCCLHYASSERNTSNLTRGSGDVQVNKQILDRYRVPHSSSRTEILGDE